MRVLITGGNGFLGAWVSRRLLLAGHTVRTLDRTKDRSLLAAIVGPEVETIETIRGDIAGADDTDRAMAGCDAVIHLAAMLTPACQESPILGARVNIIGTLAVFEAARRRGITRIAYASSAAVFGPDDASAPDPRTHYGAFKLACEASARAYWFTHAIPSVGFRPLVVYGPGREIGSTAGITLACRHAVAGDPYVIPFTGKTDAIFVDDVAAAFVAAIVTPIKGAHVFNLRGQIVTADEIIAIVRRLVPGADLAASGSSIPIKAELAADDFARLLGHLPPTSIDEGLARTVEFYRRRSAP